ncbi:MAG: RHS repeat-associated core domain-containing protein [candidate division WOR-3 bacterium]
MNYGYTSLCDALGSPRKMTNESGTVVWTGAYQPFGEMLAGSGNVHGFTPLEISTLLTGQAGKELDAEMGFNYFCQRYYDSQIGRFMTLDPIDDKNGSSPYAYCSNNPLKFTDPTGEKFSDIEMEEKYWFMKDYGMWKAGMTHCYTGWVPKNWFLGSSAELDPDFWATPDREIIPLGDGLYRCWDPYNREWIVLSPGSLGELIGGLLGFVTYTSTIPFTYLGLGLGLLSFDLPTIKNDVAIIESKKGFARLLGKLGFGGITIGHTIIGVGQLDARTLAHEMTHVAQFDKFGALFPLLYGSAGGINLGGHFWRDPILSSGGGFWYWFYWNNPFEIEARRREDGG